MLTSVATVRRPAPEAGGTPSDSAGRSSAGRSSAGRSSAGRTSAGRSSADRTSADRTSAPTMRRRRVAISLAGGSLVSVIAAALTGTDAVWGMGLGLVAALAAYLFLVARVTRLAAERSMNAAFGNDRSNFDWDSLDCEALPGESAPGEMEVGSGGTVVGHRELARFVLAYALGWMLTPFVAVVRLAGGDLDHLKHHGVIERLVRIQRYGRSQSLRLLTVGAVAAAGVTSVGALASPAFAGQAAGGDTPAASAGTSGASYTVNAGDTLWAIAARFGTTVAALASANGISDLNMIYAGQVLAVPGAAAASARSSGGSYTVNAGDTLWAIAARFGTTVGALASANGISDLNMIDAGQVLAVPGGGAAVASVRSSGGSYTVSPGDTLEAIAARFGTTVGALASANGISNLNMIDAGQVLVLPGGAGPAAAAATVTPEASADPAPAAVPVAPAPAPAASVVASPAPAAPAGGAWAALRQCESGGNYAANTGNGYYGAYQFSLATWQGLGLSGLPSQAPPAVQDQAAQQLQAQSGWGQWPACSQQLGL